MKVIFGLLVLCAVAYGAPTEDEASFRIVNGQLSDQTQFPFMVSVQEHKAGGDEKFCGGVVLSPEWILTAAHCFDKYVGKKVQPELIVQAGVVDVTNIGSKSQKKPVAKFFRPEKYSMISVHDDIALIKLKSPLTLNKNVREVALPPAGYVATGEGIIMGWGFVDEGETIRTNLLRHAPTTVSDYSDCEKFGTQTANARDHFMCVGAHSNANACQGDSGGPFIQQVNGKPTVTGVTSFGDSKCLGSVPAFYTKVAYHLTWIENTMKNN